MTMRRRWWVVVGGGVGVEGVAEMPLSEDEEGGMAGIEAGTREEVGMGPGIGGDMPDC